MNLENEPAEEKTSQITWRDVGKGFALLGILLLLLTCVFFIMSIWENEYYGLFSGRTHLTFDLVLGLALLGAGLLLMRRKPREEPQNQ